MENLTIIIIGIVFGLLISYAGLNRFNTIAGLAVLKDFTVAKTIMLVIGLGSIVLMFEMAGGGAVFHVKALYPVILPLLGENLGKGTLFTLMGGNFSLGYIVAVILIGIAMIAGAFILHQLDVKNGNPGTLGRIQR